MGIGETTSLIFWLTTPATSYAGVALYVLPGDALGVVFTLTLTLTLALVGAWGQRRAQGSPRAIHVALLVWLMGRSVIRLDPRGALCMADGTFSHSN